MSRGVQRLATNIPQSNVICVNCWEAFILSQSPSRPRVAQKAPPMGEVGAANLPIGRDLWISLSRYVSKPIRATATNGIRHMCKTIPFQQGIQPLCDIGDH